jgi:hypothetical protein
VVSALREVDRGDIHDLAARWGLIDDVSHRQTSEALVRFLTESVEFLEYAADPIVLYIARRAD